MRYNFSRRAQVQWLLCGIIASYYPCNCIYEFSSVYKESVYAPRCDPTIRVRKKKKKYKYTNTCGITFTLSAVDTWVCLWKGYSLLFSLQRAQRELFFCLLFFFYPWAYYIHLYGLSSVVRLPPAALHYARLTDWIFFVRFPCGSLTCLPDCSSRFVIAHDCSAYLLLAV